MFPTSLVLLLCSAISGVAGIRSKKLGTDSVAIAAIDGDAITEALGANDFAFLRDRLAFSGKTDQQIQESYRNISLTIRGQTNVLRKRNPALGDGLAQTYEAGMISTSFAPTGAGTTAFARSDGRSERHLEPINLPRFSTDRPDLWKPEWFQGMHSLFTAGQSTRHAYQGFESGNELEAAHERYCAAAEDAKESIKLFNEMLGIVEAVELSGFSPRGASPGLRDIGEALASAISSTAPGSDGVIDRWKTTLKGLRMIAEQELASAMSHKRLNELGIAGDSSFSSVRLGLRQQNLFTATKGTLAYDFPDHFITSTAPLIDESNNVIFSNHIQFIGPGLTEPNSFRVEGLDSVCTGVVTDTHVFFGGIDFAGGLGGIDDAVVFRFDIDPTTGLPLPDTSAECLRTAQMAGGYIMTANAFDGTMYAIQTDSGTACGLEDTDGDGCPDLGSIAGYAFKPVIDYGLDFRQFYFTGENKAVASFFPPGYAPGLRDPYAETSRPTPADEFVSGPGFEYRDVITQRYGFDGRVTVGDTCLPVTGPPFGHFEAFDMDRKIGEGKLGPNGRTFVDLDEPVSPGGMLWINDTVLPCASVPIIPEAMIRPTLEFASFDSAVDSGPVLRARFRSDEQGELESSSGLSFGVSTSELGYPSRFGIVYKEPNPFSEIANRGFFRANIFPADMPVGQLDTFHAVPGTLFHGNVAANDMVPAAAKFNLVSDLASLPKGFEWFGDGTFSIPYLTFDSSYTITYNISVGDKKSIDLIATVLPDGVDPRKPRIKGEKDIPFVGKVVQLEVYVLTISGRDYPIYQFALRPPEPINPPFGCVENHWHAPGRALVFPIGEPVTSGIPDPALTNCGFGTSTELKPRTICVQKEVWDLFLGMHP